MKVLVVGGGGREHALVWKLKQSKRVEKIYCAPGNGGIAADAECVDIKADEVDQLVVFAAKEKIDMVVVAPDGPLALGLVDKLEEVGIRAFGPRALAAKIEYSKAFSKKLMEKYEIPTSWYEVFSDYITALSYIKRKGFPLVIKADGLSLGKGVIICDSYEQGKQALYSMMIDKVFGDAGTTVVVEDFMEGPELSLLAFVDGKNYKLMVSSQDHKRALDGDKGLNTGGMGTFAPSPLFTKKIEEFCIKKIVEPTIRAMDSEGRTFKGVLYFGLMLTEKGPRVLEYNARFGDPETQVILPLLKTDIVDIFDAVIDERLDEIEIEWSEDSAVCVIAASDGYPGKYETGKTIKGLDAVKDAFVFHAGTAKKGSGIVTAGGRVLGVSAVGSNIEEARKKAYAEIEKVKFDGIFYRKDIGIKK